MADEPPDAFDLDDLADFDVEALRARLHHKVNFLDVIREEIDRWERVLAEARVEHLGALVAQMSDVLIEVDRLLLGISAARLAAERSASDDPGDA